MSNNIEYLIKFCSKESHADGLLNGKLFMNAAGYYRNLELGQGDPMESAISSSVQIFANSERPIYCMYSVEKSDIANEEITIPEQVISDFRCANGWAVLIDYAAFVSLLETLNTKEAFLTHDLVQYGQIPCNPKISLALLQDCRNLFIKNPCFAHQKEYRIVVDATLPRRFHKKPLDGVMVDWEDTQQPFESTIYSLPSSIRDIARKIEISSCIDGNGNCHIGLKNI